MDPETAAASDDPECGGAARRFGLGSLLLCIVIYVLSPGPVQRIVGQGPPNALVSLYSPLAYLNDHVSCVASFYDWYGKLWGVSL